MHHKNAACGQSAALRLSVSLSSTKHAVAQFLVHRDVLRTPAVAGLFWMLFKRRQQPLASKSMQSSSGATSSNGSHMSSLVSTLRSRP